MQCFVAWYNNEHKYSGLNSLSPIERHNGLDKDIFEKRSVVYQAAQDNHPERWTRNIRNWSLEDKVYLNPERIAEYIEKINEACAS